MDDIDVNFVEQDFSVPGKNSSSVKKRKLPEGSENGNDSSSSPPSKIKRKPKNSAQLDVTSDKSGGFGGNSGHHQKAGKFSSLFAKNPDIPKISHADVNPISEPIFSATSFAEVGVHPFLVSNLKSNLKIDVMTEIQRKAIPIVLSGRDALIKSQTGSGKTLTYAVPILHKLQEITPKISRDHGCYALIIVPTRELAIQTFEWIRTLCRSCSWIVPGVLTGGEKRKSEKARIRKGINVLVTTPGRLLDHVSHTLNVTFSRVSYLVLDEADRLTDMGYEKDVAKIIEALNEQGSSQTRQTILLSATLTPAVERLAGLAMRDRVFVNIDSSESESVQQNSFALPAKLRHHYVVVPPKLRLVSLVAFLLDKTCLGQDGKVIVFMGTQDMVDYHCDLLTRLFAGAGSDSQGEKGNKELETEDLEDEEGLLEGLDLDSRPRQAVSAFIARLHGSMEQKDRTAIFTRFREAKTGILLCTDVASRGLDLPKVHWIVQYNAPTSVEDYIHRVGRTARVGNAGAALLFLAPSECEYMKHLEEQQIEMKELSGEEILNKLLLIDDAICPGRSMEQRATLLQVAAESLVVSDRDLHEKARKSYISFVNFYATYPRAFKSVFCNRSIHLGHYAKSFALRESPSELARAGRFAAARSQSKNDANGKRRRETSGRTFPSSSSGVRSKTGFTTKVTQSQRILKKFSRPISEFDSGLDSIASERSSKTGMKSFNVGSSSRSSSKKKVVMSASEWEDKLSRF